ncbi:MAG: hypothetical protein M3354_11525 [Chloroflexota bacterium]|nr:hypothetical protein [Chloroflexota bacterium]
MSRFRGRSDRPEAIDRSDIPGGSQATTLEEPENPLTATDDQDRSEKRQSDGSMPGSRPDPGPPSPGLQSVQQPGSGLGLVISVAVAAVVLALAFYALGGDVRSGVVPLAQTTEPFFWAVAAFAVLLSIGGALYAERTTARVAEAVGRTRPESGLITAWTVPAMATTAAILLIATYHNGTMLVAGPALAFLGNAGALFSRDLLDDAEDAAHRTAATIHTLVVLAVAFFALSAIYLNKLPPLTTSLAVGFIGGLLTLETLERGVGGRDVRIVYAIVTGCLMAQAAVALDWWQTHGWTGGAVLLVCFYLASGVLLVRVQRTVPRLRDLIELGVVSLVAIVVLAITA